jgi:hypothetical protein
MFRVLLVKAEQLASLDINEQHHGDRQHAAVRRLPLLAWRLLLRALAALQNPARQPKAAQHSQRYFYVPHQEACGPDEGAAGGGGEGTSASVGGDNDSDKDSDNDSNNDSDNDSDNDSNNESDSGGGASAAVLKRIGQYEEAAAVVGKAGAGAPDVPAGHHLVDTKLMSCSCPYNAVWGRTPAVSGRLGCVHLLMALLHNPEGTLKAKDQGRLKRACVALNSGFASLRARAGAGGDKVAVWHDEGLATKAGCECAQRPGTAILSTAHRSTPCSRQSAVGSEFLTPSRVPPSARLLAQFVPFIRPCCLASTAAPTGSPCTEATCCTRGDSVCRQRGRRWHLGRRVPRPGAVPA